MAMVSSLRNMSVSLFSLSNAAIYSNFKYSNSPTEIKV